VRGADSHKGCPYGVSFWGSPAYGRATEESPTLSLDVIIQRSSKNEILRFAQNDIMDGSCPIHWAYFCSMNRESIKYLPHPFVPLSTFPPKVDPPLAEWREG